MDTLKKGNFVASHAGAEFFEEDLKLFKKTFPGKAALAAEFEKVEKFQKKQFDERILFELLDKEGIEKEIIAIRKPAADQSAPRVYTREGLEKMTKDQLAPLAPDADKKANKQTLIDTILNKQKEAESTEEETQTEESTQSTDNKSAEAEELKKKEGHDESTQA